MCVCREEERESVCVYGCVYQCERNSVCGSQIECVCMCMCVCVRVCECVCLSFCSERGGKLFSSFSPCQVGFSISSSFAIGHKRWTRSQSYQTLISSFFRFSLLSLASLKYRHYFLILQKQQKTKKKSSFYEEKILVGLIPGINFRANNILHAAFLYKSFA